MNRLEIIKGYRSHWLCIRYQAWKHIYSMRSAPPAPPPPPPPPVIYIELDNIPHPTPRFCICGPGSVAIIRLSVCRACQQPAVAPPVPQPLCHVGTFTHQCLHYHPGNSDHSDEHTMHRLSGNSLKLNLYIQGGSQRVRERAQRNEKRSNAAHTHTHIMPQKSPAKTIALWYKNGFGRPLEGAMTAAHSKCFDHGRNGKAYFMCCWPLLVSLLRHIAFASLFTIECALQIFAFGLRLAES